TRTQRADAPRDDVDLPSLLRRSVELGDDRSVREGVHLDPDPRGLARGSCLADGANLGDQAVAEVERRHEELAEFARAPEPRDVVEEVGHVGGDLVVRREEAKVLVDAGVAGMVVPRADVDVPPKPVPIPPDDT